MRELPLSDPELLDARMPYVPDAVPASVKVAVVAVPFLYGVHIDASAEDIM
jgi:uncharacterized membrane protein